MSTTKRGVLLCYNKASTTEQGIVTQGGRIALSQAQEDV
jgi:hypothetical protein